MMMDLIREKGRKGISRLCEADVYLAALLERALLLRARSQTQPVLFILGLPRSGTTLIYQYVVHRLSVAYFTNGVGRYYLAPCLATWAQHTCHDEYRSDFTSRYGSVTGPMAPHEAGRFWGRFFGFDEYILPEDVSTRDRRTMRRTVAFVQHIFGALPFVNKNVKHLLRIPALASIFPNAVFLRVHRDWSDVALSLLRARYEHLDDPTNWWSARPPNHQRLASRPVDEQIAHQLRGLHRKMNDDLSALPAHRVLSVNYESFCDAPDRLVHTIRSQIQPIDVRNAGVDAFSPSTNRPQTPEEERLLRRIKTLDPS